MSDSTTEKKGAENITPRELLLRLPPAIMEMLMGNHIAHRDLPCKDDVDKYGREGLFALGVVLALFRPDELKRPDAMPRAHSLVIDAVKEIYEYLKTLKPHYRGGGLRQIIDDLYTIDIHWPESWQLQRRVKAFTEFLLTSKQEAAAARNVENNPGQ